MSVRGRPRKKAAEYFGQEFQRAFRLARTAALGTLLKPEMVASIFSSRIACRQHFRRLTPTKTNEARMSQLENCSGGTEPERYGASRLAVRYEPIVALRLDPQNPRLHSRKQVRQIANSIASFGFNAPLLIDAEQSVIAGHGRVLAAKALGWTEVPVVAIENLDAAQRRAFAIADNRLTENSTWDDRLLAEQLKRLSILDLSFDLEATGFEMGEIDFRIESLGEKPKAPDPADQLPSLQERAVSRVGDLWQFGRHRVFCGNALDRSGFAVLMEGKTANLVFADAPYNLPIERHVSGLGAVCHREFPMASGEMSEAEFTR
jgi:hypothetical protein